MTPEYASREQVRGDAVTTATDVYAERASSSRASVVRPEGCLVAFAPGSSRTLQRIGLTRFLQPHLGELRVLQEDSPHVHQLGYQAHSLGERGLDGRIQYERLRRPRDSSPWLDLGSEPSIWLSDTTRSAQRPRNDGFQVCRIGQTLQTRIWDHPAVFGKHAASSCAIPETPKPKSRLAATRSLVIEDGETREVF
jgi:hypothetical protein